MPAAVRAGVIGLGWAGQQHMAAYADTDGVELVALAGLETDQLERLGEQYAVRHRFRDWRDLVGSGQLDVVSIATPTTLHAPVALAALEAGLHVLSEKPMAENGDVAARMVQAARHHDRVLEVSFNHRRRGDVTALKAIVDAGLLGRVYYAKAGWLRREGIPGLGSWFARAATAGGGPLMDIGVHMLDMALHLLGEPTVLSATAATYAEFGPRGRGSAVTAMAAKTGSGEGVFDVEDLSTAFLRLSDGGTLLLESSWASWIPRDQCYVTLYGSDGGASFEWDGTAGGYQRFQVWTEVQGVPAQLSPVLPPHGGHLACVRDFLAEVRSGDPRYRGEEGLTRARVVDACYASARAGHEITL